MEQNIEDKIELKDKIKNFYNNNKVKLYALILIIFIAIFFTIFQKNSIKKKNILIAEKYVQAGLHLSYNKKEDAIITFEEIILSGNEFYSILSLNTIIEKDLVSDKTKILKYFDTLENSIPLKDQRDLISLKKALFLIKHSDTQQGNEILNKLIDKNSKFKSIAQELLIE